GARGRLNSLHRPTNTGAKATENLFRSGDLTGGFVSQDRRTVVARLVGGSLRAPAQQRRDHDERRYGGAGACACRFNRCPEFFFTRMSDALFWRKVTIGHATRQLKDEPFNPSRTSRGITGFVEARTVAEGWKALYDYAKVGGNLRI